MTFSKLSSAIYSSRHSTQQVTRKAFATLALASTVALAGMTYSDQAQAAAGKTDVTITFPEIIVLHYISKLNLEFTGNGAEVEEGNGSNVQALAASASFDADINPDISDPKYSKEVAVSVENVWAVRGITKSGKIGIKGELTEAVAKHTEGGSSVTASDFSVSESTIAAPGLFAAETGGVGFMLNLADLKRAGEHTGMQYIIEANAI